MTDLSALARRPRIGAGRAKDLYDRNGQVLHRRRAFRVAPEAPAQPNACTAASSLTPKTNKTKALDVSESLLADKGAVCPDVALAMAQGALSHSPADVAVAITGVAGPILTKTAIPWAVSASASRAPV